METEWDLASVLDYLGTWSAAQYYRKAKGNDPLDSVRDEMARAWRDPSLRRRVVWPLSLRLARIR
jgi:hypothetical protein